MKKKVFRERYSNFKVSNKEEMKEAKTEVIKVKEDKPKKKKKSEK